MSEENPLSIDEIIDNIVSNMEKENNSISELILSLLKIHNSNRDSIRQLKNVLELASVNTSIYADEITRLKDEVVRLSKENKENAGVSMDLREDKIKRAENLVLIYTSDNDKKERILKSLSTGSIEDRLILADKIINEHKYLDQLTSNSVISDNPDNDLLARVLAEGYSPSEE